MSGASPPTSHPLILSFSLREKGRSEASSYILHASFIDKNASAAGRSRRLEDVREEVERGGHVSAFIVSSAVFTNAWRR